ncbi:MAG: adenosylcobinamide-GDP ribazoletransferase [Proteobacteria bacterium]|nr:adenosylcobinamide-GDP ribazoletransferase [Pseudomonadota bacterium]
MAGVTAERDEWMRRTGPLYPGLVALCYLTAVPLPRGLEPTEDDVVRSAVWFPLVGGIAGTVLYSLAQLLRAANLATAVAAIFIVVAGVAGTRAMRELGVGKTADRLGGLRANVSASEITAHGAIAIVAALALRAGALISTDVGVWFAALVISQASAYWAMLLALKLTHQADGESGSRQGRTESALTGKVSWTTAAVAGGILAGAAVMLDVWHTGGYSFVAVLATALLACFVGWFFQRRTDGATRPTLASAALICEIAALLVFAAAHPASESPWIGPPT